jgi:hypothetical protein
MVEEALKLMENKDSFKPCEIEIGKIKNSETCSFEGIAGKTALEALQLIDPALPEITDYLK